MSIFDKFKPIVAIRNELAATGTIPFGVVTEKILSPTEGIVQGRHTILAGTNNYLGLTFEPESIEAGRAALEEQGTGTTGSRMANGTYAGHVALEEELADFFGARSCIVFSTGYLACLGILSTLAGPGDVILLDGDSHASIYDGCRLGGAELVRFRHNDAADLEKRMRRLGERAAEAVIVVEGLYSMIGDCAPLEKFVEIKQKYGGYLIVDEAHSMGTFGARGRGVAELADVEDEVDFIIGTFSKSLGAIGGYCVSRRPELEQLRFAMRPYIFTASPSPSLIASTRATLAIIRARPELRTRLWNNAHRLYDGLQALGYTVGPQPSPVVATILKEKSRALAVWRGLVEHGVYVNLIMPPATPSGDSLLRCSMSAAHTTEQVDSILDAFSAVRDLALADKVA